MKVLNKKALSGQIAVVVGTRPGIIKFSAVIRRLAELKADFFIIHTGQHYSHNMDSQFFEDLGLPQPLHTNEKVKDQSLHGAQTAEMIKGVEQACVESRPSIVIVGGDANTNLAAALAVRKLGIKLVHMEAGLRSNDWSMPEEHNRVIIDHISEILLPPTELAKQNLIKDNVKGQIHIVGNPIVDAVYQNRKIAEQRSNILKQLSVEKDSYFLVTFHREENLYDDTRLPNLVNGLLRFVDDYDHKVIFPMHPHTKKRLTEVNLINKLQNCPNLQIVEALGYLDFLLLMAGCRLVLTDSGGIQEECCILQVPCVTLRENTERPETITVGANMLAGTDYKNLKGAVDTMLAKDRTWQNPFGDGKTAHRIADILIENV
jgi:UDP-N-acetylglucosamine 2-epimerase (non-hydrolysing)